MLEAIVGGAVTMFTSLMIVAWRVGRMDQSVKDLGHRVSRLEDATYNRSLAPRRR